VVLTKRNSADMIINIIGRSNLLTSSLNILFPKAIATHKRRVIKSNIQALLKSIIMRRIKEKNKSKEMISFLYLESFNPQFTIIRPAKNTIVSAKNMAKPSKLPPMGLKVILVITAGNPLKLFQNPKIDK
jgi:hypothetical protein